MPKKSGTRITKQDKDQLRLFAKKAKIIVERIGTERDNLRDLLSKYQDILDSVDLGHSELQMALDIISEQL